MAMLVLFATDDLGSGLLFYGIFLGMLYVATARLAFVAAGLGLFLVGSIAVYQGTPHVRERVLNWLQPWTTHKIFCPLSGTPTLRQDCQSYQEVQSLYSIAHGGMGGTGLGRGTFVNASGGQIIPDLKTDFIYSALAQELGLIGAAGLLLVYMVFTLRGFRVAIFAGDGFSKLLAAGLTFGFAFQTFIIVGGILRVIPLTGITLPLVSYGGSSILANFLVLAGLMLVSNRANAELAGAR
jgi:cell division protein FtsW (lipid II flippase)